MENVDFCSAPDLLPSDMVNIVYTGAIVKDITQSIAWIVTLVVSWLSCILCVPVVGQVMGVVGFFLIVLFGIGGRISDETYIVRRKFVKYLSEKIYPKLSEDTNDVFQNIIRSEIRTALKTYVDNLVVDIQKMQNEMAISLIPDSEREKRCFLAAKFISQIDNQLQMYEAYRTNNVK
jgi:hypothetical protein